MNTNTMTNIPGTTSSIQIPKVRKVPSIAKLLETVEQAKADLEECRDALQERIDNGSEQWQES